ncbi:MAG: monofunctional biosynthetic peptidoglycan transglycosylase [Acidobacteriia bacterium]|nr:monofunctional biosynthetic peptidoglycan transglycosylase [Terriglobia bacterium]
MRLPPKRTVALAVLVVITAYLGVEYFSLPDVTFLRKTIPAETALMRQRDEEFEASHHRKAPSHFQVIVPYQAISNSMKTAVLIGEDDAFFQHEGFDYQRIKEALTVDWEQKRFARGASTVTQQLAKNLFLSTSKNPVRKLKEAVLAYRLERDLGKRRIFEIYLNVIEWGQNVYGAEAASRYYLGKSAAQLTLNEAVLLAAIIPNPLRMNPLISLKRSQLRRSIILDRMYRYHHISEEEYRAALSAPLILRTTPPQARLTPED